MARKRHPEPDWSQVYYRAADRTIPAYDFLAAVPKQPRVELLTTVAAVTQMGPPRFPTGMARWQVMHKPKKKGEVDMSGICEARDKHSGTLYRLFCLIDRDAEYRGVPTPSLVLLDGVSKPERTVVPQAEYARVDAARQDWWATRRVAETQQGGFWFPDFSP